MISINEIHHRKKLEKLKIGKRKKLITICLFCQPPFYVKVIAKATYKTVNKYLVLLLFIYSFNNHPVMREYLQFTKQYNRKAHCMCEQ